MIAVIEALLEVRGWPSAECGASSCGCGPRNFSKSTLTRNKTEMGMLSMYLFSEKKKKKQHQNYLLL